MIYLIEFKEVKEMNKNIRKYFVLTVILFILLPSCSNEINTPGISSQITDENLPRVTEENLPPATQDDNIKINGGKTLDEAMDYYIKEIESSIGSRGDFFTGKYKIIDTVDTSENVNVYFCIVSQWVDKSGNVVSGHSGLARVRFEKENNLYIYENREFYDHFENYNYPDIPQKVNDILSNNVETIFNELNIELDKEVENYVNLQ